MAKNISYLAEWGDVHDLRGESTLWISGLHALAAIRENVGLQRI